MGRSWVSKADDVRRTTVHGCLCFVPINRHGRGRSSGLPVIVPRLMQLSVFESSRVPHTQVQQFCCVVQRVSLQGTGSLEELSPDERKRLEKHPVGGRWEWVKGIS